ncbi:MAG: cytochrome-c oxidase, cbb3-type subunit III [Hyphomonas sp.]|uniref:cytochrome-c oxidase, cbb3-type subunit III n=1 Tax=Hyphomonas sp. TaxID=87 RepID=UPI0017F2D430|nr:cytochrome-c oxidase, cbb3-type subunit III [Hyphomonas sp.]MBA3070143.1 cytochrome-c oxidase, cbb3-type subunit III [Hyphomonas sp.]MBU3922335.1 cytochrome-c oxidase, cbb3-type subunit III [Alphaproteobacteria bacterium]MBU4060281.1 cytochrome-c oxidase, cbb3-type subunit III [Alphaproteobacteria bacterium]MBU4162949.1 cytochrome-c oxidase, cbb3-type subunit III [Alphaproteobacteria bacterium]
MTDHKPDIDEVSGVETTGHSWDGIKELNTPLPRWWLFILYSTIVWAVIYMIFMPAIPALPGMGYTNTLGLRGHSDRALVAQDIAKLHTERNAASAKLLGASLSQIETDLDLQQFALAMGESAFGDNCATCHGAGGRGAKGYPMLADDVWLWDGTLTGIETTIRHGIRHMEDPATRLNAMPAFGRDGLLATSEIDDLVQYVLNISGREAAADAVNRAAPVFAQQCVVCHGADGKGNRALGAPNLTDRDWLFGGEPRDIQQTIFNARNAHMPAWQGRLDDATIKSLAVYVHSLGGGEK